LLLVAQNERRDPAVSCFQQLLFALGSEHMHLYVGTSLQLLAAEVVNDGSTNNIFWEKVQEALCEAVNEAAQGRWTSMQQRLKGLHKCKRR
jgi:hypothetical protein